MAVAIALLHGRRTTQRWTHAVGYQQQNECIADQIVKILNDRLDKIIYVMWNKIDDGIIVAERAFGSFVWI